MFVDGLGYAYYLDDGNSAVLIAAGFKGANGDIFTEENGGVVAFDEDLQIQAQKLLDIKAENEQYLATLAPGVNPVTGGGPSPYLTVEPQDSQNNEAILLAGIFAGNRAFCHCGLCVCICNAE